MDGADEGFAVVGGYCKVGCQGELGVHDVDVGGFFDALQFAVAVACEEEGFDGGHFGAFKERHVELRVDVDVLVWLLPVTTWMLYPFLSSSLDR